MTTQPELLNLLWFQSNGEWSAKLEPVKEGEICEIQIVQEGSDDVTIRDVLFGDVWVCSGQSNMEWPLNAIFDAQQEIADMANYNIRLIL